MKVLLIGGNGYIGSSLYYHLANNSPHKVTSVDACWHNKCLHENIKIDYKHLTKDFYDDFDAVVLVAAHSSVPMCSGNFLSSFNNNTVNFTNLLDKIGDQKLIYASTSSVYGYVGGNKASEDFNDFRPNNHYDKTKILSDQIARDSGKNYYGLRFGTVNGRSPIFRTDIMINAMSESYIKESKIKLFAADIHRPILAIKDLIRAVRTIIDGEDNPGFYNLASFNSTVEDIGIEVARSLNCQIDWIEGKTDLQNQSLPYSFSIDTSKFEETFNFECKENIITICNDVVNSNYDNMIKSPRIEYKEYL